eukprot:314552_1
MDNETFTKFKKLKIGEYFFSPHFEYELDDYREKMVFMTRIWRSNISAIDKSMFGVTIQKLPLNLSSIIVSWSVVFEGIYNRAEVSNILKEGGSSNYFACSNHIFNELHSMLIVIFLRVAINH